MISYAEIAKANAEVPEQRSLQPLRKNELDKEDPYFENTKDSMLLLMIEELRELCEDFIDSTSYFDEPFLTNHRIGKTNFIHDILDLFESNATIELAAEYEAPDEDSEEEL